MTTQLQITLVPLLIQLRHLGILQFQAKTVYHSGLDLDHHIGKYLLKFSTIKTVHSKSAYLYYDA